ncbi:MAG: MotA/TolQ/ExbB proton channel family protein [Treponema sp.]|jgi:biopolymer transport protein ExbB|nr:MotA/TolQ/ExbB proton channel family protein [Treponema sp.]
MIHALDGFVAFMNRGGPINWCIAALYVLTLFAACNRAVYFFCSRYNRKALGAYITACGADESGDTPIGQPYRLMPCFLSKRNEGEQTVKEALEREGTLITREMCEWFSVLSFIIAAAPLAGLLGTITGLMAAFRQIEALGGAVDMASLSGGIGEAMITTASGLVTAISASAARQVFEHTATLRAEDMTVTVSLLLEHLRSTQSGAPAPEAAGPVPEAVGLVPEAVGLVPETRGLVSEAAGPVPEAAGLVSEAVGLVPEAAGPVPEATGLVSEAVAPAEQSDAAPYNDHTLALPANTNQGAA